MVKTKEDTTTEVQGSQLRSYIERLETLNEQKKEVNDDFKDVMLEAKSNGFDTNILRKVLKIRAMDRAERIEMETVLDLYLSELGDA